MRVLPCVATMVAGLVLLAGNVRVTFAQCSVGCASASSCAGSGGASCTTECTSTSGKLSCSCSTTRCRSAGAEGDEDEATLQVSLGANYNGPGYIVAVSDGTFLVADCRGNVRGVAYSVQKAQQVEIQLRVIPLQGRSSERGLPRTGSKARRT